MLFNGDKYHSELLSLSNNREGKILVIFVHGLGGNKNTWRHFKDLIQNDHPLCQRIDIAFYCYSTGFFFKPLRSFANLETVADGLKTFIDINCFGYDKIILVGHSMGGLICRKYLLSELMYYKSDKVKALILYATPNNGSDLANLAFFIGWINKHVFQLKKRSDFFRELGKNWSYFKVAEKVKALYVVAGEDWIVDEESARSHWGERSIAVDIRKGHLNIVKAKNENDTSYLVLLNEIALLLQDEEMPVDPKEEDNGNDEPDIVGGNM